MGLFSSFFSPKPNDPFSAAGICDALIREFKAFTATANPDNPPFGRFDCYTAMLMNMGYDRDVAVVWAEGSSGVKLPEFAVTIYFMNQPLTDTTRAEAIENGKAHQLILDRIGAAFPNEITPEFEAKVRQANDPALHDLY